MGMPGIEGPWVAPIFTAGVHRPACRPSAEPVCSARALLCRVKPAWYQASTKTVYMSVIYL